MSKKITKELKELVSNKVISPEGAEKILQYYDYKKGTSQNRLFTVFGIFGALLVGSGIILILAHNWDNFSKMVKTILAFVPLVIGQFFVGYSILKDKSLPWKEASGTFLFFAVGASISLVSQIYNISGELGSFLTTWIALCLPIIYLLRSQAVALLILLLSVYYAVEVGVWNYRSKYTPWLYIVFFLSVLPNYWVLVKNKLLSNTTAIFNWIVPISFTIALGAFIGDNEELLLVMYITLFGAYYNIGKLPVFDTVRKLKNGFSIIGSLGTVFLLMIFTFKWPWEEFFNEWLYTSQEFYISMTIGVAALMFLGYTIKKKGIQFVNPFQLSFLIFLIIFFFFSGMIILPRVLINILVFALGVYAIKTGVDSFNLVKLNYGLLMISVLIICRFFDADISFVLRGVLFVIVGAGFFLTNFIMLKNQQKTIQ